MRTEGGDVVVAADDDVAAADVADDEVAALVVEAAARIVDYVYAAVLAASRIAGSSHYFSNFQENLLT